MKTEQQNPKQDWNQEQEPGQNENQERAAVKYDKV